MDLRFADPLALLMESSKLGVLWLDMVEERTLVPRRLERVAPAIERRFGFRIDDNNA